MRSAANDDLDPEEVTRWKSRRVVDILNSLQQEGNLHRLVISHALAPRQMARYKVHTTMAGFEPQVTNHSQALAISTFYTLYIKCLLWVLVAAVML